MGSIRVTTTLQARGPAAAIVLDDAQVATVGEGPKRFPVRVSLNGHMWRTSVARMRGEFLVGLNREVRQAAGVAAGDTVEALIELDTDARTVDVPDDLAAALAGDDVASQAFETLSFTHRKEYVRWIEEAKRDETRARRVAGTLERLRESRQPS
jgi:hypothetical protein